jgi:hypothetical protein
VFEQAKTIQALDRTATVIGCMLAAANQVQLIHIHIYDISSKLITGSLKFKCGPKKKYTVQHLQLSSRLVLCLKIRKHQYNKNKCNHGGMSMACNEDFSVVKKVNGIVVLQCSCVESHHITSVLAHSS